MRRGVGEVAEEGTTIVPPLLDVLDHAVGIEGAGEEALGQFGGFAVFEVRRLADAGALFTVGRIHAHGVIEMARAARYKDEGTLEAPRLRVLPRLHAEVPFTGHVGVVAVIGEQLGKRGDALVQVALVAGLAYLFGLPMLEHGAHSGQMVIHSGEQHGAGHGAGRTGIEVGQADPLVRKLLQGWGGDLATERLRIRIAQVVSDDQQDIRTLRCAYMAAEQRGNGQGDALEQCSFHWILLHRMTTCCHLKWRRRG
ncbi:hypothetical protein D3C85_1142610 [compost metagenome]